ncbi:BQ5605_C008g05279 [Microbotryum silenes-dioicae]|uniref:BQ5605_C008g05279 protein n=1 Tax=Microbotryum silenes-dioicae TaxID=796604 RepID=A0A2X0PE97_9BASI|nr:BQ5605_C008g05279 [Microbotryum silenes-dioicae]
MLLWWGPTAQRIPVVICGAVPAHQSVDCPFMVAPKAALVRRTHRPYTLNNHSHIKLLADKTISSRASSGALSTLNKFAAEHSAVAIIHSGDFGFYEPSSLPSISDRTLRHLVQYSSLISPAFRSALLAPNVQPAQMREMLASPPLKLPGGAPGPTVDDPSYFGLSDFPKLLAGEIKLRVPVYTVWGACEDVAVLEKIRIAAPSFLNVPASAEELQAATGAGEGPAGRSNLTTTYGYSIPNLTVLDEATTRVLLIGGVRLRLFGLGGAVVSHKLFDNGTGNATIAGGGGTMWTTVLQVGELVDTAQKVYDATETRLLVSHASPGREGLLAQLALVLKADLTVSAGLHFRYGVSYNEFSVQHDPEAYKLKLEYAKKDFNEIWDTVKSQVESVVDQNQRVLLNNALAVANRVPSSGAPSGPAGAAGTTNATEETAWKNCWNWNLPDAAYGSLLLDIVDGRIGSEMRSQGFNFAYRQNKPAPSAPAAAAPESSGAQISSTQNASTTAPKSAETKVETTSVPAQAPLTAPSAPAASTNPNVAPPTDPSPGGPGAHRGGRGGYGERGGRGGFGPNGRTASGRGGAVVGRSNGSWSSGGERTGPEGGFRGERKERNETAAASNGSNNTNESKVPASGVAKDGDRAADKKIEATSATAGKEEGASSTPTTPSASGGGRGGHNGRSERGGRHSRGGQAGHKSGGGGQHSSSSGNGAKEKESNNESSTAAPATPVASGAASGGGEASSSESAAAGAPTTGTSGHGERGGRGGRGAGRGRGGGRGGRGGGNHHQTASGGVERGEGWNSSLVPEGGRANRKENNNNDEGGKSKSAGEGWSAPSDAQEGGQGGW